MEVCAQIDIEEIRHSLEVQESLARAHLMTPQSAKNRLVARSIEFNALQSEYEPPKELLMYLVRMGSFTSATKIQNGDTQDNDLGIEGVLTRSDLQQLCQRQLEHLPPRIRRAFTRPGDLHHSANNDIKYMKINSISKACSDFVSSPNSLRVFQWNILSQSLGVYNDNFVCCPEEALEWKNRRYRIIEEIIAYCPDVICLQEVDHFNFLSTTLGSQGYAGMFFPKPDSPCLYINGNNGPDGCAIFYRTNKFDLLEKQSRILELWRVQSNQVAVLALLRIKETGQEICVSTTHLKARSGALLSTLRNEQGKDLLEFVSKHSSGRPTILCGDFNAEPTEPVYSTILSHQKLGLNSAYSSIYAENGVDKEPQYTTWKIREEGEVCHTLDYIFYSKDSLKPEAVVDFPSGEDIGDGRVPSLQYPSDHFSLICDFRLCSTNARL